MEETKKRKIIILDDDKFLVNMYINKFKSEGAEAEHVDSGEELLKKVKEGEKADMFLLDIIVPGLSGMETLEALKKENLLDGSKVVMLTNESNQTEIDKAKSLGADGYIVKAMATPSEVVEQVMKILG